MTFSHTHPNYYCRTVFMGAPRMVIHSTVKVRYGVIVK